MSFLIRQFRNIFRAHLSDVDLVLLIGNELPSSKRPDMARHLDACSRCRARCERLEHAASQVLAYRDGCVEVDRPRPAGRRALLVAQLKRLADARPDTKEAPPRRSSPRWALPAMNPILATAMVFALVSVACVFVWLQQARPNITSNALLVHAEAWDPAMAPRVSAAVIRQTVKIKTSKQSLERTIYRDAQGKRQARQQKLPPDEEQLRDRLASAGVAWDAPLAATGYQDWHDHQRVRHDQIRRAAGHLLVLTTTTPNGDIEAQSLAVRDSDFHPIERTVAFRDSETIEIAEVDYQVLPWNSADAGLFQPEGASYADGLSRSRPALIPLPPALPTQEQLDETELGVRLVLNELQADTGEQIQIERGTSAVEVKGLVETDRRKRELLDQLRIIPRVKTSILSMEELKRNPENEPENASIKVTAVAAQPSPLEAYFVSHGKDAKALRSLSQQLLENAVSVSQESRAISDLNRRFAANGEMSALAQGTLSTLFFSHQEKQERALDEEQRLFNLLRGTIGGPQFGLSRNQGMTEMTVSISERNLLLCEELTLGSSTETRQVETIMQDMATTLMELRRSVQKDRMQLQNTAIAREKK